MPSVTHAFPTRAWRRPLIWLPVLAALAACGQGNVPAAAAPGGGRPAPEVGVVTVMPGEVALQSELPGRLEASRVAQVRARAAGILQQRVFAEGSDVRAGQILFQIDPAPYEAALQTARASLARAEASLTQARTLVERYGPLVAENAISQQEFANAQAARQVAEADVAAGQAAVRTASINLGHARVTAPIAGRIGRALVTEGALVGQGEATPLAVIQQIDPLFVNFSQPASEALRLRRALESGQLKGAGQGAAEVRVLLDDGTEHPAPGRLLFTDLTVDPGTGQVSLRAELPNPNGQLLPGLFVRVRLVQASAVNAITLPQQAVSRSARGDTVRVVKADGQVEQRPVKVGGQQGGQWIVLEGLAAGEQVMVDGIQKLQMMPPGTPVKAVPWTPAGR
ncbi:MAG TPA: efflux RND transporter periplasmic adaptor subunit [Hydrogenophaga sp.]|uniref:efflux RND transporter periplasmic adaptor subunit n=1 Tax=Hydrogenophaga sp. TaxID=1904254 RepID=UPI002BAA2BC6|nr:efflux RND transporter periplasmic adaptor subunit [Hydrogenophaga sp.]HMN91679.1 efflux RND transporter periplasmic adaptor subunit [Hydrogenophaga sp.]